MRTTRSSAVLATAALVLAAAGCGDSSTSSDTTPARAPAAVVDTTAAPTGGADTTPRPTPAAQTTVTTAATTTVPCPAAPAGSSIEELLARGNVSVAHSGGALEGPDETLYAFGKALRNGADVLEMNLMLSSDGQLVVIHDPTVERTTNGTGEVTAMTAADLNALDAAYWWVDGVGRPKDRPAGDYTFRGVRTGEKEPPECAEPGDFAIPTLAQVVERFPGVPLDLEMEEEAGPGIIEALAGFIEQHELQDRVVVVSQSADFMDAFVQRLPGVAASPGLGRLLEFKMAPGPIPGYRLVQIPPQYGDIVVTDDDLKVLSDNGLPYWFYLGDLAKETATDYAALLARGANGMIVDRPSVLAEVLPSS